MAWVRLAGPVWSRTPPALRASAIRDRSDGRARQGRSLPWQHVILIRHIRGLRSCWKSATRPAQPPDGSDRGCPLGTVGGPPIWHTSGTTGRQVGRSSDSAGNHRTYRLLCYWDASRASSLAWASAWAAWVPATVPPKDVRAASVTLAK